MKVPDPAEALVVLHHRRFEGVGLYRVTGADQIAVTPGVVDARHWRPELALPNPGGRVGGLFPRVGPIPILTTHRAGSMRSVAEYVVLSIRAAFGDIANLLPDGNEASHRRSSSNRDSLSVGSTIRVPITGQDMVGA